MWPEANLVSRGRSVIKDLFFAAGHEVLFADSTDARRATGESTVHELEVRDQQIKLMAAVRRPTPAITLTIADEQTRMLKDSGRWVEMAVPVAKGD